MVAPGVTEVIDMTEASSGESSPAASPRRRQDAAAAAAHQSGHAAYTPGSEAEDSKEPAWELDSNDEQAGDRDSGDSWLPLVRASQLRAPIGPLSASLCVL